MQPPQCSVYLPFRQGKRLFIKDITHYLVPPNGKPASIAPSLARKERGVGTENDTTNGVTNSTNGTMNKAPYPYPTAAEPNNPTVIPETMLKQFHFTFLIRHPRSSIPSYYRCTVPPLNEVTGFYNFMPSEAGYDELRRVFDFLHSVGYVGPNLAGQTNTIVDHPESQTNGYSNGETNKKTDKVDICVVDADDLLDNPAGIIEAYCKAVGLDYNPNMLNWDSEEDHKGAKEAFEKWSGFHEDAIHSSSLKPRLHVSSRSILFCAPSSSTLHKHENRGEEVVANQFSIVVGLF